MKLKENYQEMLKLQEKASLVKQHAWLDSTIAEGIYSKADRKRLEELETLFADQNLFVVDAAVLIQELLSALNQKGNDWFYWIDLEVKDVDYDLRMEKLYDYTISIINARTNQKIKIDYASRLIPANYEKLNYSVNLFKVDRGHSDLNLVELAKNNQKAILDGVDLEAILWDIILKNKKINLWKKIVAKQNKIEHHQQQILQNANEIKHLEEELANLEI